MAFCIGRRCKNVNRCQDRCGGWFGAQPDIERACKKACRADYDLTREEFLCSGNWIDQAIVIGGYGYDPCLGSGMSVENYLDPLNQREAEKEQATNVQPWLIGGAALVVIALIVLVILKRK